MHIVISISALSALHSVYLLSLNPVRCQQSYYIIVFIFLSIAGIFFHNLTFTLIFIVVGLTLYLKNNCSLMQAIKFVLIANIIKYSYQRIIGLAYTDLFFIDQIPFIMVETILTVIGCIYGACLHKLYISLKNYLPTHNINFEYFELYALLILFLYLLYPDFVLSIQMFYHSTILHSTWLHNNLYVLIVLIFLLGFSLFFVAVDFIINLAGDFVK